MTAKQQSSWAGLIFMGVACATVYSAAYTCATFAEYLMAPRTASVDAECVRATAVKLRATRDDYLSMAREVCQAAAAVAGH
jgi:hypothetical protein